MLGNNSKLSVAHDKCLFLAHRFVISAEFDWVCWGLAISCGLASVMCQVSNYSGRAATRCASLLVQCKLSSYHFQLELCSQFLPHSSKTAPSPKAKCLKMRLKATFCRNIPVIPSSDSVDLRYIILSYLDGMDGLQIRK